MEDVKPKVGDLDEGGESGVKGETITIRVRDQVRSRALAGSLPPSHHPLSLRGSLSSRLSLAGALPLTVNITLKTGEETYFKVKSKTKMSKVCAFAFTISSFLVFFHHASPSAAPTPD